MMYSTECTLDGISSGIGAFIRSRKEWLQRSDKRGNLFTNFKALEGRLSREHLDYHDVIIQLIIHDKITGKVTLDFAEAVKNGDQWIVNRYEQIYGQTFLHIYKISEITRDQVVDILYISSKKADTHLNTKNQDKDAQFEYKKLHDLRKRIINSVKEFVSYQKYGYSLVRDNYGLAIHLDDSSAVVHIWSNSRLMDYNTEVKKHRNDDPDDKTRCLPFVKNKDKYGTIYMFITCDESDSSDPYTQTVIDKFKEELITSLQEKYPEEEISYLPCPFQGKVLLNLPNEEG